MAALLLDAGVLHIQCPAACRAKGSLPSSSSPSCSSQASPAALLANMERNKRNGGALVMLMSGGGANSESLRWSSARLCVPLRGSTVRVPRSTVAENATPQRQESFTVGDYMTPRDELFVATVNTTIDEALEVLVEKRITGMPVVDEEGNLVGVVSDYDLLALDSISGKRSAETSLFPEAGRTWKAFKEIQKLLIKTNGKTVGDVMTPSPLVVRERTNLEDAARVLLDTKFRRLPVVDVSGKLVGLLTRCNVVRAALHMKRIAEEFGEDT